MSLLKLPPWATEALERERVARLGLLDADACPRVLPITFAVADGALWSAIDDKPKRPGEPARVGWLRTRPEASVLVDSYDDDWRRLWWVQLLGRVTVVEVTAGAAGFEALAAKYPQYRERRPPGPLLRMEPQRALHWRAT